MRLPSPLVLVLVGCGPAGGGPSNNNPGRYGTIRVSVAGFQSADVDAALANVSRLGPGFERVSSGASITVSAEVIPNTGGVCTVIYDYATHTATMATACLETQGPYAARERSSLLSHAIGHLLGMAHVCLRPAQVSTGTTPPCSPVGTGPAVMGPWDYGADGATYSEFNPGSHSYDVTQLDIDEFVRTHP